MNNVELTNMCMLYDDKGNVLVEDRVKSWKGIAFPGGHVEYKESIVDSVKREIKEETGLDTYNLKICGVKQWFDDECHHICFLFPLSVLISPVPCLYGFVVRRVA